MEILKLKKLKEEEERSWFMWEREWGALKNKTMLSFEWNSYIYINLKQFHETVMKQ
jgi:hypothetical protein